MAELITQIFDAFMDRGLHSLLLLNPVMSLLVEDEAKHTPELLSKAFSDLCNDLRAGIISLGVKEILEAEGGSFNYCFHSLRDSNIVMKHLSTTDTRKF